MSEILQSDAGPTSLLLGSIILPSMSHGKSCSIINGILGVSLLCAALLCVECGFNAYQPTDNATPDGLDAEGYTREGERYLRDGDFETAAVMFQQAMELDGNRGYARLGYAKAAFDNWGFTQSKVHRMFASDTDSGAQSSPFTQIVHMFETWTLESIDSLYAPVHVAVDIDRGVLNRIFESDFVASDGFTSEWIAADFSLLLAFHAFIGLMDWNDDGRITSADNPFEDISIQISEDTVIVDGLDQILNDPELRGQWIENAQESIAEAHKAAEVFVETFGDSTTSYESVDSLLANLETTLVGSTQ